MKIKAPSFADLFAETSPQLGGARRTKFLETLDRIIPWQYLKALIGPYYLSLIHICSVSPALINPGVSHNVFIAKLASMEVMTFIGKFSVYTLGLSALGLILLTVLCFIYKDYKGSKACVASDHGN